MNIEETVNYVRQRVEILEAKKGKVRVQQEALEVEIARYDLMIKEFEGLIDRIMEC